MSHDAVEDMIQIELSSDDSFNIVRETLTRMGIKNDKKHELYQTAHILHKRGNFYICHFKEMFILDGKTAHITFNDVERRNRIALLLEQWNLVNIITPVGESVPASDIDIIPFKDKEKWELIAKYTIGKRHEKH